MKSRQRWGALWLSLVLLTGCGASKPAASAQDPAQEGVRIGIIQLAPHNALDAGYEGFLAAMQARGYEEGKNLTLDYNNALGEVSNVTSIAQKVVHAKPDLIFAIATPAAQGAANQTQEIPIVITAVTDPAAAGLVASNEKPGGNVTGTSDLTPVADQMELLHQLVPKAKTVGLLFNSSEDNARVQVEMARTKLQEMGLDAMDLTVSKTDEIVPVVQSAIGKVDVLYAPTDNLISANLQAVTGVTTPAGIPVICGEEAMLERGGLATRGIDYRRLGEQAGAMAADILEGKAKPADMPIQYQEERTLKINTQLADELGLVIPEALQAELQP